MFSKLYSAGLYGMDAFVVEVETDISSGLPRFDMVGLPDTAVKEARERVRSSAKNCGYQFPQQRITVNFAPADMKKSGVFYDLPVLVSVLKASGQIDVDTEGSMFIGELSLSGEIRPANGVLPMVIKARQAGFANIFVPHENAAEGSVVTGINVYAVHDVKELINHLTGESMINPVGEGDFPPVENTVCPDFSDVRGQVMAKRALEVAAAGGHNVLLIGTPGAGKSMLAKRIPSILPDMTFEESIETTKLHSIAGVLPNRTALIRSRPFRSPHHTVSSAALAGGGTYPKPGEVSLAHNGVLFLDELPEFSRNTLEVLRQPLEDGRVVISRVSGTLSYPCNIMLVAAMNPCPCGYYGHPVRQCTCPPGAVSKYLNRVSGPLLDRLDIHIEVPPVEFEELNSLEKSETSAKIRERVNAARKLQQERYSGSGILNNASLTPDMLHEYCTMSDSAQMLLKNAFERLGMSARGYDRILKLSRTVADLDSSDIINSDHISEAIQYRSLDRKYWK